MGDRWNLIKTPERAAAVDAAPNMPLGGRWSKAEHVERVPWASGNRGTCTGMQPGCASRVPRGRRTVKCRLRSARA